MGSKNQPGVFDCWNNAEPEEPMFILLGRDRGAPQLVRQWADARAIEIARGQHSIEEWSRDWEQIREAYRLAAWMEDFKRQRDERRGDR